MVMVVFNLPFPIRRISFRCNIAVVFVVFVVVVVVVVAADIFALFALVKGFANQMQCGETIYDAKPSTEIKLWSKVNIALLKPKFTAQIYMRNIGPVL